MENYLALIITAMLSLGAGAVVMWVVINNLQKTKANSIIKEAEEKAEVMKKDRLLEAKEKFLQLKSEHDKEVSQRNQQILKEENKLKQMENTLKQKIESSQINFYFKLISSKNYLVITYIFYQCITLLIAIA
jgi:ribonuclease Y